MKKTNNQPLPLHMALPCLANSGAITLIKAAPAYMSTLAMQIAYELNVLNQQGLISESYSSRFDSAFTTEFSSPSSDIKYTVSDASSCLIKIVSECALTKKDQTLIYIEPSFRNDSVTEEARIAVNKLECKLTQIYISPNQTSSGPFFTMQILEKYAEYVYSFEQDVQPDHFNLKILKNGGTPFPSRPFVINDLGTSMITPFCHYEVV